MNASRLVLQSVIERCRFRGDGFDCFREGAAHRLQIWGSLPAAWAGHLALNTYVSGLQILTGDAVRTEEGVWAASFLLRADDPRQRVRSDFLTMARRAPRTLPDLPEPMVSVAANLSLDCPGHVFARVTGRDSIGLLAEILRRFEIFHLRPRRFTLRTVGDEVRDWFWLEPASRVESRKTGTVSRPSDAACEPLRGIE